VILDEISLKNKLIKKFIFKIAGKDSPNSAANLLMNHHKSRGLAAAILSSSLNTSSQFISPPLPGHIAVDDYKRDKSNDHDLKRDINVNSLILNTSNMEESSPSTPSSKTNETGTTKKFKKSSQQRNYKKNSNSSNEMIIISNAVNYEPKRPAQLSTAQSNNFKASSESLSSSSSTLFVSNNANKSNNAKLNAMTDVLKAVDGDIIFGCNYVNHEANAKSPFKNNLGRDLSEMTNKRGSESFKSKKKISLSIDSLLNSKNETKVVSPIRKNQETLDERQKILQHQKSQDSIENASNSRNILVNGLKRNVNSRLGDVVNKDIQSKTKTHDKSSKTLENENVKGTNCETQIIVNYNTSRSIIFA
jgi:hypothetical protein